MHRHHGNPTSKTEPSKLHESSRKPSSRAAATNIKSPKQQKRPPDPDGLFKQAAARAARLLEIYRELNPQAKGHFLANMLLDLICLSERKRATADVHRDYVTALDWYVRLAAENMWAAGWFDDFRAAREGVEEMMLTRDG